MVIDCGPISFLDAAGVKALKQLVIDFDKCNVQVLFAAMAGTDMYTNHACLNTCSYMSVY